MGQAPHYWLAGVPILGSGNEYALVLDGQAVGAGGRGHPRKSRSLILSANKTHANSKVRALIFLMQRGYESSLTPSNLLISS